MLKFASEALAHDGLPVGPHDALAAWHLDPLPTAGLVLVAVLYRRGWHPVADGRPRGLALGGALGIVLVALMSPIDEIAGVLLSGHMVQHVLLTTVAAPLLAWVAPLNALSRGTPAGVRMLFVRLRRSAGIGVDVISSSRSPLARLVLLVGITWFWHSALLYEAAVENDAIHAIEHASFLGSAWLFWSVIVGPRRQRATPGVAMLAVFILSLQGAILAMLMTFSTFPWYSTYSTGVAEDLGWGLGPLADQQLAGVLMGLPAGILNTAVIIAVLIRWLHVQEGLDGNGVTRSFGRDAGHESSRVR